VLMEQLIAAINGYDPAYKVNSESGRRGNQL
jgi:hypothetical protein